MYRKLKFLYTMTQRDSHLIGGYIENWKVCVSSGWISAVLGTGSSVKKRLGSTVIKPQNCKNRSIKRDSIGKASC